MNYGTTGRMRVPFVMGYEQAGYFTVGDGRKNLLTYALPRRCIKRSERFVEA